MLERNIIERKKKKKGKEKSNPQVIGKRKEGRKKNAERFEEKTPPKKKGEKELNPLHLPPAAKKKFRKTHDREKKKE